MERNYTYPSTGISRVRMKLTWAQLELVSTSSDQFQAIIAGDDESVNELRVEHNSEDIVIAQPQLAYAKEILPRRRWLQICLRIPKAWQGDLDADTVSGTIGAHGISLPEISLTTVSAAMNVREVTSSSLLLHTVAGAISGIDLSAKRANLRCISGNIAMTGAQFGATRVFTVSGSTTLSLLDGCRTVDAQSVSGSLCVETDSTAVKAALHSLSGQFIRDEDVPAGDGGLEISASSVSGDLAIKRRSIVS